MTFQKGHKGYVTKEGYKRVSLALTGITRSDKTKLKISLALKGKKLSAKHIENLVQSHLKPENEVKYGAKHHWVRKNYGKAIKCEKCFLDKIPDGKKRYFGWANLSGKYKRDRKDWLSLCMSCHHRMDRISEKAWTTKRLKKKTP